MLYDKDIREPLFEYLEEAYGKVRIFEEKDIGLSRADAVMVCEEHIIGIEIKSDADTYSRLARQIKDYNKFFDSNIIVVGSTHAKSIEDHVPDYWGILSVEIIDDNIDFYCIREPKQNPENILNEKIKLLWRPELAKIQEECGLYKYADRSKDFVRNYICEKVEPERLNRLISYALYERDYSTIAEEIKKYRQAKNPKKEIRKKRKRYSSRKTT